MERAEDHEPQSESQRETATAESARALSELNQRLADLRREFRDLNQRDITSP